MMCLARRQIFFFRMLLLAVLILAAAAATAAPFIAPGETVSVYTEYSGPEGAAPSPGRTWILRGIADRNPDRSGWAAYAAGADEPFCTVHRIAGEDSARITMTGPGRQAESDNGLLLLPGYPAPCSVLPAHQSESERFYDEKRQAGGRVFVRRYRVFWQDISLEEAGGSGWLQAPASRDAAASPSVKTGAAPAPTLRMLTAVDENNAPVVRQLWREGDRWWLYEETPFKRSWRVE